MTFSVRQQVAILHPANTVPEFLAPKQNKSSENTELEFAPGVDQLKGETQVKSDTIDQTPLRDEQLQELFTKLNLAEDIQEWQPEHQKKAY